MADQLLREYEHWAVKHLKRIYALNDLFCEMHYTEASGSARLAFTTFFSRVVL